MNRPTVGSDPGWPRPRQPVALGSPRATISVQPTSALIAAPASTSSTVRVQPDTVTMPIPWIARANPDGTWALAAYDSDRGTQMVRDDLCQVCGGARGGEVFVLVGQDAEWPEGSMSGGALCSERCARLTAAVCPHYRQQWPVRVVAVPHLGVRTSVGSMRDLDDLANVETAGARHVSTVGGSS